jgi:GT2 family glycosyltransferase
MNSKVGVVVIGRNEGDRLRRCLESSQARSGAIVYVDSGSTDGSRELARRLGVDVVELDLGKPFTAARARNAGFERLEQLDPSVEFVQFVDGDCEIAADWLDRARAHLEAHPEIAIVFGRRRERHPDASIYNRVTDMEWDTPVGESLYCGGDIMIRAEAFRRVGGFNPTLIAGEEPELCVRLRRDGGRIFRLDAEMTVHDIAITRFGQWWRRSVRAGYAFALGSFLHGQSPERHWVRETYSNWFWGLGLPAGCLLLAWPTQGWSLLPLAAYPIQWIRIAARRRSARGDGWGDAMLFALFCVMSKFSQAAGQVRFLQHRVSGRRATLIEYKS